MIEYRSIMQSELTYAKRLWANCFTEDSDSFIQYYFKNCVPNDSFLGAFIDNKLVSMLQIKEYLKMFRGKAIKTGYLTAVCTEEEYRMQGHAKKLIEKAFEVMKEKNIVISSLYPFNYEFYEKFGYAICSDKQIITLNNAQYPKITTNDIEIFKLEKDDAVTLSFELLKLYKEFMSRFEGYIIRDIELMKLTLLRHLENKNTDIIIARENGRIVGYSLNSLVGDSIIADEVVYKDIRAFAAISKYLIGQAPSIKLTVPKEDKMDTYFECKQENSELKPHIMHKVIDINQSLDIKELQDIKKPMILKITNILDKNKFNIYSFSEQGIMEENDKKSWDIECTENVYAQTVCGYIGFKEGIKNGLVKVQNNEQLTKFENIFKENSLYVFEMF